jgi:Uncharacterized conserved protein
VTEKRDKSGAVSEVNITKILDAPRGMVFKAWTDPNQVGEWWGPHQFTNRIRRWDAQKGGGIDVDMIAPDGTVHTMTGTLRKSCHRAGSRSSTLPSTPQASRSSRC